MKLPIHLENRDQLGARIVSPSAGRNKEAIGALLADHLPKSAKVFEVASGSGEHGLHICQVRPDITCLLYTSPSPRDATLSRMPSSA